MKKDLGVKPYTFPMPVLMIATYGENDKVDVMNMAWGGVCASNMVALNIDEDHKTTQNIKERMAFTLSVADIDHLEESDFFGIASGNKMEDKFERTGMHAVRSDKVDAPVIEEYPLTLECKVVWSARWLRWRTPSTASASWARLSTSWPTRRCWTKTARSTRPSSTPLSLTRCAAAIIRLAKRSARPGRAEPGS